MRALALSMAIAFTAQGQTVDTLNSSSPLFTVRDVALIGGFVVVAAVAVPVDKHFARELRKPVRQSSPVLRNSATVFQIFGHPGALVVGAGLYMLGRLDGQRRVEDLGLHSVEALVIASTVTGVIKTLSGRARPYVNIENSTSFELGRGWRDDAYRSFPSGHTTLAFTLASIVSSETVRWWPRSRWLIGPAMYTGATLTGVSRIYNNEHWASDAVAGAAIGTLTGLKVFRYQHSHPNNTLDRTFLRAGVEFHDTGRWLPHLSVTTR